MWVGSSTLARVFGLLPRSPGEAARGLLGAIESDGETIDEINAIYDINATELDDISRLYIS